METSRRLLRYKEIVVALVMAPLLAGCVYQGPLVFGEVHEGLLLISESGREVVFGDSGLHLQIVKGVGRAHAIPTDETSLELLATNRGQQFLEFDATSFSLVDYRPESQEGKADPPTAWRSYPDNWTDRKLALRPGQSEAIMFSGLRWGRVGQRRLVVRYLLGSRASGGTLTVLFPVEGRYLVPRL